MRRYQQYILWAEILLIWKQSVIAVKYNYFQKTVQFFLDFKS